MLSGGPPPSPPPPPRPSSAHGPAATTHPRTPPLGASRSPLSPPRQSHHQRTRSPFAAAANTASPTRSPRGAHRAFATTAADHVELQLPAADGSETDENEDEAHRVIQMDPTGRFHCWNVCLGRGAYKEVYKAFDTEEGVEVAWNQLRCTDGMSKRELQKVCSEVHLLQRLHHENIIQFFHVWAAKSPRDGGRERVFFITELMTSGTLSSYVRKAQGPLKPKVLKNLCRHILRGLAYLHSCTPPVIHRDLKLDNIFINGNNGVCKLGDLGLATLKTKDHVSSVLGTPEFMAPELYDESYNERVDIYAFGMCVLELVTKEYPYQECSNQAQIYKRVTAGIKPLALDKVTDPDTREFIELCIEYDYHKRPTAEQLLNHPFLAVEGGAGAAVTIPQSFPPAPFPTDALMPADDRLTASVSGSIIDFSHDGATDASSYSVPLPFEAFAALTKPRRAPDTVTAAATAAAAVPPPMTTTCMDLPPVSSTHADVCGSRVTMDLVSIDVPHMTVNLKMTTLAPQPADGSGGTGGGSDEARNIKFPFLLVEDTPTVVVAEMVREGIMDLPDAASQRQVEHMIRTLAFGDETSAAVLAYVNRPEGVALNEAELEAWMSKMQAERLLLDDEEDDEEDDDEFDDGFDDDGFIEDDETIAAMPRAKPIDLSASAPSVLTSHQQEPTLSGLGIDFHSPQPDTEPQWIQPVSESTARITLPEPSLPPMLTVPLPSVPLELPASPDVAIPAIPLDDPYESVSFEAARQRARSRDTTTSHLSMHSIVSRSSTSSGSVSSSEYAGSGIQIPVIHAPVPLTAITETVAPGGLPAAEIDVETLRSSRPSSGQCTPMDVTMPPPITGFVATSPGVATVVAPDDLLSPPTSPASSCGTLSEAHVAVVDDEVDRGRSRTIAASRPLGPMAPLSSTTAATTSTDSTASTCPGEGAYVSAYRHAAASVSRSPTSVPSGSGSASLSPERAQTPNFRLPSGATTGASTTAVNSPYPMSGTPTTSARAMAPTPYKPADLQLIKKLSEMEMDKFDQQTGNRSSSVARTRSASPPIAALAPLAQQGALSPTFSHVGVNAAQMATVAQLAGAPAPVAAAPVPPSTWVRSKSLPGGVGLPVGLLPTTSTPPGGPIASSAPPAPIPPLPANILSLPIAASAAPPSLTQLAALAGPLSPPAASGGLVSPPPFTTAFMSPSSVPPMGNHMMPPPPPLELLAHSAGSAVWPPGLVPTPLAPLQPAGAALVPSAVLGSPTPAPGLRSKAPDAMVALAALGSTPPMAPPSAGAASLPPMTLPGLPL
ncbi:WNK protein kinase [Allomyces macrogynus ATCC 38327]|uniref:non-specific serine/threonine protein kinase n=1 Tax=Allomyces macrogynus (strain ATCC 38327) TaxID=578462 RepID=A0A0L0SIY2_ALLM3|nr:WNK protein kinase [Allomyces macrogynus ATCC 38327]|eukprot:KNE62394.1 WNK protein kinase [Allomyces macrogynus ATCC 38327]